jgi:hypothetical protein
MNLTRRDFARAICVGAVEAHPRSTAINVVTAWMYAESGPHLNDGSHAAENNPLNATLQTQGSRSEPWNSVPVQNYITPTDGLAATIRMLRQTNMRAIVDALASAGLSADDTCRCIGAAPWGTSTTLLLAVMAQYRQNAAFYNDLAIR